MGSPRSPGSPVGAANAESEPELARVAKKREELEESFMIVW